MANNVTGQKTKKSSKGKSIKDLNLRLLNNLYLQNDLSLNRQPILVGRIRHFIFTFRSSFSSFVGANVLTLLFFIPLVYVAFFFVPALERQIVAGSNFIGDLGLGLTGATNDTLLAIRNIYSLRIVWMSLMIPCIMIGGIGMAGLFYCVRNRVWGAKISVFKHFFRGVKKYWWQYMTIFTYIGSLVYGIYALSHYHLLMMTFGAVPAWTYVILALLCVLSLLTLIFLSTYLGTINMYKIPFAKVIKNSIILSLVMFIPAIMVSIAICAPFLLLLSSFTKVIFMILFMLGGFSYIALVYQEFAQYAHDAFTNQLIEQRAQEEAKKQRQNARGTASKKKRK